LKCDFKSLIFFYFYYIFDLALSYGNTDTRHAWGLSSHIYRFSPLIGRLGIHTMDESVPLISLASGVQFFSTLILNANNIKDE